MYVPGFLVLRFLSQCIYYVPVCTYLCFLFSGFCLSVFIMYQYVPTWVFGFKVFRLCTSMYVPGFLVLRFLSQCIYYVPVCTYLGFLFSGFCLSVFIMYQYVPTWVFGFKVFRLCTSMSVPGFLVLRFSCFCLSVFILYLFGFFFKLKSLKYSKIKSYLHYLLHATNLIPEISHYKKNLKYQNNKNKSISFHYDMGTLELAWAAQDDVHLNNKSLYTYFSFL